MISRRFLLMLALLANASAVSAQDWYRVEAILVAYQNEAMIDHEIWPVAIDTPEVLVNDNQADMQWWLQPQLSQQTPTALWAGFNAAPVPQANWPAPLQPLPYRDMEQRANRIHADATMDVIWHQAWLEPIQAEDTAVKHPINLDVQGQIDMTVRGTLSLYRSRYLHVNTDLKVQHQLPLTDNPLQSLTLPNESALTDYRSGIYQDHALLTNGQNITPVRAAHIQQSRRMRSGEMHYVDHPMIGLIIKVDPVDEIALEELLQEQQPQVNGL